MASKKKDASVEFAKRVVAAGAEDKGMTGPRTLANPTAERWAQKPGPPPHMEQERAVRDREPVAVMSGPRTLNNPTAQRSASSSLAPGGGYPNQERPEDVAAMVAERLKKMEGPKKEAPIAGAKQLVQEARFSDAGELNSQAQNWLARKAGEYSDAHPGLRRFADTQMPIIEGMRVVADRNTEGKLASGIDAGERAIMHQVTKAVNSSPEMLRMIEKARVRDESPNEITIAPVDVEAEEKKKEKK